MRINRDIVARNGCLALQGGQGRAVDLDARKHDADGDQAAAPANDSGAEVLVRCGGDRDVMARGGQGGVLQVGLGRAVNRGRGLEDRNRHPG